MKYPWILFLSLLFPLDACTDARLQPLTEPIDYVDDTLAVSGQFCTSEPDEVPFPVKILIVIDQSASLQCTDPGNNRLVALSEMGTELDPLPNVEFGVIGFASWTKVTPFTTDWDEAAAALAPENGQGGPATDYQGALATVLTVIEQDVVESGAAETARTRYVVLFMSDGIPEPRCRAGCDDGDTPPDSLYGVCNTSKPIEDGEYVDMQSQCPEYNQDDQILQRVQDLMSLKDYYGIGDLSLSTVLLFAPEEEIEEVCGDVSDFGYVKDEAEPLLRSMADLGGGTYQDVNISTDLGFLDLDYESLEAPYEVAEFFAINLSTMPNGDGVVADSDHDGLDDAAEFDAGLDRLSPDSDGDGFGDLLETRYRLHGFDPTDPSVPTTGCADDSDRDGDGLRACEEAFLETDPLLADTDGDRLPDGIELRFGTDPTVADASVDHDFDGRLSGFEIHTGTHPMLFDDQEALLRQVHYSLEPGPLEGDGTRCYDFLVQNLSLVPALSNAADRGTNRVLIVVEEEPSGLAGTRGRFHVACVTARYLSEAYKVPASGLIDGLAPDRFVDLALFDPDTDCLAPDGDPTVGLEGGE